MNLNGKQILSIILVILGVLMASTAQLNDLFGSSNAKIIISIAGLLNAALAGVNTIISSQSSLVTDVQAMPGVEKITVNAQANKALAGLAIDPANEKIDAAPGATQAVNEAAKG